jgi:ribosome production factor 1
VSKPVGPQKTLDNTRESDPTMVQADDEEFVADEAQDEFASYFRGDVEPKIIITSCYHPSKVMYEFIRDLLYVFPNSFYYKRMNYTVAQISEAAKKRGYTDLLIINQDRKTFNALTHVHLPEGPTAYYKLSNVTLCRDIEGHGRTTSHQPEVILNNFATRLGARVGRMLGSLFHQQPNFRGRRVVTFHNQRDFIFFRHHRYIFEKDAKGELNKARLQQLGPKFTLKLRWLQHGVFDPQHGELEWMHKKEMDTSRRRFFL